MLARSTTITIMSTASEQGRDDHRGSDGKFPRLPGDRSRKPRRAAGAIAVHEYRNCSATASLRRACGCEVRAAGPRGATAA